MFEMSSHEVRAVFLVQHPHICIVDDDGTKFWYDDGRKVFLYQKIKNKKHNGVYVARGMMDWYESFIKRTCK